MPVLGHLTDRFPPTSTPPNSGKLFYPASAHVVLSGVDHVLHTEADVPSCLYFCISFFSVTTNQQIVERTADDEIDFLNERKVNNIN
jgi:hypothetical protein